MRPRYITAMRWLMWRITARSWLMKRKATPSPGLSFNAVSEKAVAASKGSRLPKAFWNWENMLSANANGWFPYTPATNLFYGLSEACDMLLEEGLDSVFARHARHAEATRTAATARGVGIRG